MSVPNLPDDPTEALYPVDWAADGDLKPPTALQPTGFPPNQPLAGQHLNWVLRHVYFLLGVLFGGTLTERKVSVWPGHLKWQTASNTLRPLNRNNDSVDTFTQLLAYGIGQPARTLSTPFSVSVSTQALVVAGNQGGLVFAMASEVAAMAGGTVAQVRVRIGDLGDMDDAATSVQVLLTGSDGLVRTYVAPDPIVANAWNVMTLAPVPDPLPGGALQNLSDDPSIPGPIDVLVVWAATQDSLSLGTEEVLFTFDEIEVTFGT